MRKHAVISGKIAEIRTFRASITPSIKQEVIYTIRLSYLEISKELADFLDQEGDFDSEDMSSSYGYWFHRGAVQFCEHLKAACSTPEIH